MKKTLYIAYLVLLLIFTGCYDSNFEKTYLMAGDLTTLPCEFENATVVLRGKTTAGSGDYLYFEVNENEDFKGSSFLIKAYDTGGGEMYRAAIDSVAFLSPRYYYRMVAINGNDTLRAPQIDSFGFKYTTILNEPEKVTANSAELSCITSSFPGGGYFMVATNPEFEDYYIVDSSVKFADIGYNFYTTLTKLEPNTTYYAKLYLYSDYGHLESNAVSFTTSGNTVQSISIKGEGIDGTRIKDDLMIVIWNGHTAVWSEPYTAVYDENKQDYVVKDFTFEMDPGSWYIAYACSGDVTWVGDGIVVFSQDDYNTGYNQTVIYRGVAEFSYERPNLDFYISTWTCRLTVAYPAGWGEIYGVWLNDEKKGLPGNSYNIMEQNCVGPDYTYRGVSDKGCVLSEDGTKYLYTFNIFPTTLTEYCTLTLPLESGEKTFTCPEMRLLSGREYVITINGNDLEISDVTVNPWAPTEGGSIVINP